MDTSRSQPRAVGLLRPRHHCGERVARAQPHEKRPGMASPPGTRPASPDARTGCAPSRRTTRGSSWTRSSVLRARARAGASGRAESSDIARCRRANPPSSPTRRGGDELVCLAPLYASRTAVTHRRRDAQRGRARAGHRRPGCAPTLVAIHRKIAPGHARDATRRPRSRTSPRRLQKACARARRGVAPVGEAMQHEIFCTELRGKLDHRAQMLKLECTPPSETEPSRCTRRASVKAPQHLVAGELAARRRQRRSVSASAVPPPRHQASDDRPRSCPSGPRAGRRSGPTRSAACG